VSTHGINWEPAKTQGQLRKPAKSQGHLTTHTQLNQHHNEHEGMCDGEHGVGANYYKFKRFY
jgi:hypothetical protein